VRHDDEVEASRLQDSVKDTIREIHANPTDLHEDLDACWPRGSGNPTHQFTEPRETELGVAAEFRAMHELVRSECDTLEELKTDFYAN